uniref:Uncharacterized protein n=1 Tax=Rhizophora mucronata TaxID=61149 RepID=A0A2P2NGD6_RHIMU
MTGDRTLLRMKAYNLKG